MFQRIMNHDILTLACSFKLFTSHFRHRTLLQHYLLPNNCLSKEVPKPITGYVPLNS